MSVNQNMNQQTQTPMKGDVSHIVTPSTLSVVLDPATSLNAANPLLAGDFVALSNAAGNAILVDVAAANSTMFGVALYSIKKDKFVGGDALEVGLAGTIVYMESVNAIARGQSVEFIPASHAVQAPPTNSTATVVGVALDKASTSGQLIRVKLS